MIGIVRRRTAAPRPIHKTTNVKTNTKRATVSDVAHLANVGTSTVSRYLRGIQVKQRYAESIAKAIGELNYTVDESARALRSGRSGTIGVVLAKVSNSFFSRALQFMEEETRRRGCTLVLLTHGGSLEEQIKHLATVRRYKADGVILTGALGTTLENVNASLADTPIVAFDHYFSPAVDSVMLDNRTSVQMATEHLIGHGYKKIGCVCAMPEIYSFSERISGFVETMAGHDLRSDQILGADYAQLKVELKKTLTSVDRPEALLSFSDRATHTILAAYSELGLKKKDRLPVLAYDDFDLAPYYDPPFSVIQQPIGQMVSTLFQFLFERIEGRAPSNARKLMLPSEMILRRSCGC